MREINRRRHERILFVDLAFGAGETEHHALVTGAFFFAAFFFLALTPMAMSGDCPCKSTSTSAP